MLYEVMIPSAEARGYDESITVDAPNWMSALKSGLERTGETDTDIRNVMCDIKDDNSIHVTDATTRRVFVLRELDPEVDHEAEELRREAEEVERKAREQKKATSPPTSEDDEDTLEEPPSPAADIDVADAAPHEDDAPIEVATIPEPDAADAAAPVAEDSSATKGSDLHKTSSGSWVSEDGRMRVGSATHESLGRDKEQARVLREKRSPTSEREAVEVGRAQERISENILEDVFLEIQTIHEGEMPMEDAVNFVMELAMEKVPADSGAVLFADVHGRELYFATARGPKSDAIMDFRVPMGQGIAGFCAREGVSLAISDAQNDPRFYRKIQAALGYETQSVVCAPIQHEGRVYGCLELINRREGSHFTSNEVNALTYIGKQFAEYINRLIMAREKL